MFRAVSLFAVLLMLTCTLVQAEEAVPVEQGTIDTPPSMAEPTAVKDADKRPTVKTSPFAKGGEGGHGVAGGSLVTTAVGLVVVLVLIMGMAWALRRFGGIPGAGKGAVTVVGGISLGPRERAVLLQVGDTQVLVGVAPGQVRALHVLDQKIEPTAAEGGQGQFAKQLGAVLKGGQS